MKLEDKHCDGCKKEFDQNRPANRTSLKMTDNTRPRGDRIKRFCNVKCFKLWLKDNS